MLKSNHNICLSIIISTMAITTTIKTTIKTIETTGTRPTQAGIVRGHKDQQNIRRPIQAR